jgi:peptide/nickel transport system permease protein
MLRAIGKRLPAIMLTAFASTLLIFLMMQLVPGDPASAMLGTDATPEMLAQVRHQMGLDRPLAVQYLSWLWDAAHGHFGISLLNRRDIGTDLMLRLPNTLELSAIALFIALLVGIPLGILGAVRHNKVVDNIVTGISGLGLAMPEFWIAMIAVNVFALQLFWVPATGIVPWSDGAIEHVRSIIMPAITLSTGAAATITRFTRNGMIEALGSNYIRTAWAAGLSPMQIYFRYALKNTLIQVTTVAGIVASSLIGGAILVENVFVIPGLGSMLGEAVLQKDYTVIQAVVLFVTMATILINLAVDMAYRILDPRIR